MPTTIDLDQLHRIIKTRVSQLSGVHRVTSRHLEFNEEVSGQRLLTADEVALFLSGKNGIPISETLQRVNEALADALEGSEPRLRTALMREDVSGRPYIIVVLPK